MTTNDDARRLMIAQLIAAQAGNGPVWSTQPSEKRTSKPRAKNADDSLIPRVEQAFRNRLPDDEKAEVMKVLRDYGICGHTSENEYYSRSRKAVNAILKTKGTATRKGVDDALATGALTRPISHMMMKAAYYTIGTVAAHSKSDWLMNLEKAGLRSMLYEKRQRIYPSNESAIIAYWDSGMVSSVRQCMRRKLDHIVDEAVVTFNNHRSQGAVAISRDELKLKAYGIMAVYMRDAGLVDNDYAAVTEARREWIQTHPDVKTPRPVPIPAIPSLTTGAQSGITNVTTPVPGPPAIQPPAIHPPAINPPAIHPPAINPPAVYPPAVETPTVQPAVASTDVSQTAKRAADTSAAEGSNKKPKSRKVFHDRLDALERRCIQLEERATRCDELEVRCARLEQDTQRHLLSFKIIRNLRAEAVDVVNYQTNVKAAITKGFQPGPGPESLFHSQEAMREAWNELEYFEMDGTIGPLDGERHPCTILERGGRKFALINSGPWVNFEKSLDPGVQIVSSRELHDDMEQPAARASTDEWDSWWSDA